MNDSVPIEGVKDDAFYQAESQRLIAEIGRIQSQIVANQEETRVLREDTQRRLTDIFASLEAHAKARR